MRKILGKINSKIGYPLLVFAMVITSILGVFVSDNFEASSTPITVPGGTATDGSTYNNYTFNTDSTVTGGYGQDIAAFKRVVDNPYGTYAGSNFYSAATGTLNGITSNVSSSIVDIVDTGDGYLVMLRIIPTTSAGLAQGNQTRIQKYDYNFNLLHNNVAYNSVQYLAYQFLDKTPGQTTYKMLTNAGVVATIRASDGAITSMESTKINTPVTSGYMAQNYTAFTESGWFGSLTYRTSNTVNIGHIYQMNLSTTVVNNHKVLTKPYSKKITGANRLQTNLTELDNGNFIMLWSDIDELTGGVNEFYQSLSLYDSNFNPINSKMMNEADVENQQRITFLTTSSTGNPIFQLAHPTNGARIVEYDKSTGMEVRSKDFAIEGANFSQVVTLSTVSNGVNYYFIGNAKGTGQFSGYTTGSGVVLAGLDENFNVMSANFLNATAIHEFTSITELPGDKLLVTGRVIPGALRELFNQKFAGSETTKQEGFLGTMDQTLDYAPKLKVPTNWNITLDGTETAAQIDNKMLKYISDDMNGETNRYDDYTSNADLLKRINKNVYSVDYENTAIDWSLFGLTAATHATTGNNTYKVGPNTVTYAVADGQLSEAVVSGRVNICSDSTVTDNGNCDTAGAEIALNAENIRVQQGNVSGINYIADANMKAWVLGTGAEETNTSKVTWNTSAVQDKVGVYPVTYTYTSQSKTATKTIYVSVYDADTISGHEDNGDTTPPNKANSELLRAASVTMRVSEATGKTLDELTGVKAWNAETGSSVTYGSVVDKAYSSATPAPDTYTIDYTTTNGTTKQVTVTLTTGAAPTLTVTPAVISVDKDATLTSTQQVMSGVSANDADDGNLTGSITYTGTVNTANIGTHYIEYTVTDADGNVATGLRAYTVGAKVVGTDYAIYASNFTKNVSAVNTAPSAIITDSNAYAQKLSSATNGTVQVDSLGGYTNTAGGYVISLSVVEEPSTTTTVIANVIDNGVVGTRYAIEADDIQMYVSEVSGRTPLQLFAADGLKAWDVTTAADMTSSVSTTNISPTFNTASPAAGVYTVTLSVGTGANQQTLTKTITLLGGGAPSLTVTPTQVLLNLDVAAPNLMDGVTATDVEDGTLTGSVTTTGTVNTAVRGVYNITYSVTDTDNNTTTATRRYIVGDNPVIGTDYVLFAENFTEHVDHVNTADSAIIATAKAEAFKLSDGTAATVNVTNKGGYAAIVGPYQITFAVGAELTTTKTIVASVYKNGNPASEEIVELNDATLRKSAAMGQSLRVITEATAWNKNTGTPVALNMTSTPTYNTSNPNIDTYAVTATTTTVHATANNATVTITAGDKPVINVTNPVVQLAKGATLTPSVLGGVSVTDTEDDAASINIAINADKTDGNINMNQPGVYIVTYTATDSDGNAADPKTRTYIVGAQTVTGNYAVFGSDYTIRRGLVDTVNPDDQIKNLGGLKAILISDGTTLGTIDILNNSGYTDTIGNYNISFDVAEDTTSTGSIIASVIAGGTPTITVTPTQVQLTTGSAAVTDANIRSGVNASDPEDGDIGAAISYTGSVDTDTPGTYIITYSVTDADGNIDTATRTYLVGAVAVGTNYAIYGTDFSLRTSEVDNINKETQIRNLSGIKAEKLSDASSATVSMVTNGGYTSTVGSYTPSFRVDAEPATTGSITATVTNGSAPSLTVVPTQIALNLGDITPTDADIRNGVSSNDVEQGDISAAITYTGSINTSAPGIYVINYTVSDADGNIATGKRSYIVGATAIGTEYAIFANDFTIRTGEVVAGAETQIKTKSNIKAQKISDGSSATVTMLTDGGYTGTVGTYTPNFRVDAEPATTSIVNATVVAGDAPVLTITPTQITLNKGDATPNLMNGVTATDTEDGNITTAITTVGTVNTATAGTYIINYTVTDSDGNIATGTRSYLVAPLVVGTDYAIYGNDFSILIGDVNVTNKEGQIRTESNIKAENIHDGTSATLTLSTDGGYTNVAGTYITSFYVDAEPATSANINATVGAGTIPTITVTPNVIQIAKGSIKPTNAEIRNGVSSNDLEDGDLTGTITYTESINTSTEGVYIVTYSVTDNDGNTVTATRTYVVGGTLGTDYAIFSNDFTLRIGQVAVGGEEAQIRTLSNVRAQKLSDGSNATVSMTSSGGYTNVAGTYTTTFNVDNEATLIASPIATISAGTAPTLIANPERVQLMLGATPLGDTDIRNGVTSTDAEDGTLTGAITYTGTVDTNTAGTYVITYSVTDSDNNTVTATRSYLVGAIAVGTNYAIYGKDFSLRTSEVNLSAKETQIRTLSDIKAEKISDGSAATVSMVSDGGYTNTVGSYTPNFRVDAEAATIATITATVSNGNAPVMTVTPTRIELNIGDIIPTDADIRNGVVATDAEQGDLTSAITYTGTVSTGVAGVYVVNYTVQDADGNIATGSRSYIVGAKVVGTAYAIFGDDFNIRTGQVNTAAKETQIRTLSGIKAQKISDGTTETTTMATDGGYTDVQGVYTATFRVDSEPATAYDVVATVADGDAPTLTITPAQIILNIGDATPNVMTGVTATDTEDGNITTSLLATGSVNTAVAGTYIINYSVTDSDGNTVTSTRSYLVSPLVVGTDYAIYGNDFNLLIGDVNTANKEGQIRTRSNIKAEKISDGSLVTVTMSTDGGYTNIAGTYTAAFYVDAEPATSANINATVGAGTMPTITVSPSVIQVAKGGVKPTNTDIRTGVVANDVEDGDISTSITYTESINMAIEGVYIVTYSVTDSDNNTVTATRTYVVGGVVGTDYAIFADSFTLRTGQVAIGGEEAQIRTLSNVRAQKLSDGSAETVTLSSDGGYTNIAGTYTTTFTVDSEPATKVQPVATVTSGNVPVINVTPTRIQLNVGDTLPTDTDIRTGVNASDAEDGNLTTAITYTGTVDTSIAGTYVITYSVTDSDGNVTTNTRSYLVGAIAVGTDYAIYGDNFTLRTGEVNTASKETQIRTLSNIKAEKISDGSAANVTLDTDGGYTNVVGAYTPTFKVNAEPATTATITATVIAGNNPVMTIVPNQIMLSVGDAIPNDTDIRTGVSVSDVEDGDITASVSYTGTINTAIAGTYVINYSVTDSDGNSATGIRSYLVSPLVVGTNYAIYATDYTILKGSVDTVNKETQIRTLSNVKAEKLSDGSAATVTMITDGGYTATAGAYTATFRVDAEPATTGNVIATVSDGAAPVLTVTPNQITLTKDATTPNVMSGVSALDAEDGNITSSITNIGSIDTSTPGTYVITYSVTDSDGNVATATRSYLVAPLVVGTDYAIYGNDFALRKGQVNTATPETQIRTLSNIKAEKISDGSATTITMTTDTGYTNVAGIYLPAFEVDAEPATTTYITATITDGDNPTIIATPNQEILTLNATALSATDIKNGVVANDTEDGNITAAITYTGTVNTAVAGTYVITYSVTDSDGNVAVTTRSYLVAPLAVGTDYAIYGEDFSILTSAVDISDTETQIRTLSGVKAEKISDGSGALLTMVHDGGYNNTVGAYLPLFRVSAETGTTTTITATVVGGNAPTLTVTPTLIQLQKDDAMPTDAEIRTGVVALDFEDGNLTSSISYTSNINTAVEGVYIVRYSVTDADGNLVHATRTYVVGGVVGTDYAIFGDDFTIRAGEVVASSETQIRTKSNIRAQKLSDGSSATMTMLTDGGYTNSVATYFPTFEVDAEPGLTHTITADVVTGTAPIITATPDVISLNIGDAPPTLLAQMTGVVATDAEDGTITPLVTASGTINTAVAGTYIITYSVTDSDGNLATAIRSYLVGAIAVGTDYAIYGDDFTLRTGQVDTIDPETQIRTLSNIRAEKITDTSAGMLIVNTLDSYTNVADTYLPEFAVLEELTTVATIAATVIDGDAPVLVANPNVVVLNLHDAVPTDADIRLGVSGNDTEDGDISALVSYTGSIDTTVAGTYVINYSVTDSDGNSATAIRSYLVNPLVVGANHAIYGDAFTLRIGEVDVTNKEAQIRSYSNVRAERLSDAAPVTLTLNTDGGYTNTAAVYFPIFEVDAETTLTTAIRATVIKGDKPVISTPNVEGIAVGDTIDLTASMSANDTEDGDITSQVVIGGDTVDTTTQGVYHVTYDVTDSDGNVADTVTKVVVVGGVLGTDYAIFAHNFTHRVGDVNVTPAAIITDGGAYAVKLSDKTVASVNVANDGGYVATPGVYGITYAVANELATEITIDATVITGDKPIISTPTVESVELGGIFNPSADLTATDTEDGDVTNQVVIAGHLVDTNNKGVYHVTYNVTDSDGNAADEVTKIVIVGGEYGAGYAIFANDFTRRIAQVDLDEAAIIADGQGYAVKLDDRTVADVVVSNLGGYTNAVGTYNISYAVANEMSTTITVSATVVAGAKPIITAPAVVNVNVGGSYNSLAGVSATDAEDGNITSHVAVSGDVVETANEGVYHVTYNVTDSDGNAADEVLQIVVVGGTLGDEYAIFAHNFTNYISEVNTADSAIIADANAYAVKLSDRSSALVHITDNSGYTTTAGMYPITFAVSSEPATTATINAYVVDGNRPEIFDHTPVVAVDLGGTINAQADVAATDVEDGDLTASIIVGGDTVDTTVKGVYHVTYNVTDRDGNVANEVIRVYVVGGVLGTEYAIFANDFTKYAHEVDTQDHVIITHAEAYAVNLADRSVADVHVADKQDYCGTVGTYPIAFAVTNEATTIADINATVKDFEVMLEGNDFTVYASEIEQQVADGTLEDFIIEQSAAKATIELEGETQEIDVIVNADTLKTELEEKDYNVVLGVTTDEVIRTFDTMQNAAGRADVATVSDDAVEGFENAYKTSEIVVTVLNDLDDNTDDNTDGSLISTGEAVIERIALGSIVILLALLAFILTRKIRKTINE